MVLYKMLWLLICLEVLQKLAVERRDKKELNLYFVKDII